MEFVAPKNLQILFLNQKKILKQTNLCVGFESCELIFVNDHASDKLEPVLDVEFVCFLGRDIVRMILSTLLTFNGKR